MSTLLTIAVPTYNEADNVLPLLRAIRRALHAARAVGYEILFVDDSSDQTPDIIRSAAQEHPNVRLIHRPPHERTGLATAFVTAFREARGEYICCIDSDLQHPPEVIPAMLQKLERSKADIAVASRYVPGGSAEGLGSAFRKFISKATKYLCHLILSPARCTTDPGSGFFLFRRTVIGDASLSPKGFKILLEILVRGTYRKVIDVAYSFRRRAYDQSKATFKQGIAMLSHIGTLFWNVPSASRFFRFMVVGAIGTVINLGVLYLCRDALGWSINASWLAAVLLSIAVNFILNSRFTFPEHRPRTRAAYVEKYASYTVFSFLTLGVNYLFFSAALSLGTHYLLAAILGIAGAFVANFLLSKHVVWSPRSLKQVFASVSARTVRKKLMRGIAIFAISYVLLSLFIGMPVFAVLIVSVSLLLTLQGLFSLYTMIYTWEDHENRDRFRSPAAYSKILRRSFTALVPARHEEAVIGQTIRAINAIRYPEELKEVLVICRADDTGTIEEAERAIAAIGNDRIRLVTFDGYPINKPHGLNIGLAHAAGDIVTIFDAEDEPHPDLYQIINTIYETSDADVVQSGVQLMNHHSSWYSLYNVLEYFFWFKSNLHFFSSMGLTPLGGNTVFFKQEYLRAVGGWDQECLTEDADIGIRLCAAGAKIRIVYDEKHVTQEETPPTLASFIKQRTRWNQGFVQILLKGEWKRLPKLRQRLLAFYILSWPIAQGLLFIYTPIALWIAFTTKMPVLAALIANLPLYILGMFLVVYNIGLWEFMRGYGKRYRWYYPLLSLVLFIPFQIALGLAAFRAVYRVVRGHGTWEKTRHTNAHRSVLAEPKPL